jgi:hypothetical protein
MKKLRTNHHQGVVGAALIHLSHLIRVMSDSRASATLTSGCGTGGVAGCFSAPVGIWHRVSK